MRTLPYRPHPLLRSGHLQTLLVGVSYGYRPPHHAVAIEIPLEDGETLVVHEELGPPLAETAPLAILIHGLGGDHSSPYLQRIAHAVRQNGMRVWRVDLRGSGHGMRLACRPTHAGASDDLATVIADACRRFPLSTLHIAGFSLSGNILLKMLGECGAGAAHHQVDLARIGSATAIAPPVDLHHCANNMDRLSRRLYSYYYLKVLDAQVRERKAHWPQWNQIPAGPTIKTIREFDARYTAPLCGFDNTDDYYTEASAKDWLREITTKTTLLVDRHDPIVTVQSFKQSLLNPQSTQLVLTSYGGHMGYFGIDESGRLIRWMEHFVIQKLKSEMVRPLPTNVEYA
jgi:predicted alpha/beta-fold hydrolase